MRSYLETQCNLYSVKALLATLEEHTNSMLLFGHVMQGEAPAPWRAQSESKDANWRIRGGVLWARILKRTRKVSHRRRAKICVVFMGIPIFKTFDCSDKAPKCDLSFGLEHPPEPQLESIRGMNPKPKVRCCNFQINNHLSTRRKQVQKLSNIHFARLYVADFASCVTYAIFLFSLRIALVQTLPETRIPTLLGSPTVTRIQHQV